MTHQELRRLMSECEQTPGQSVLAHGRSVCDHFDELTQACSHRDDSRWRLPSWFVTHGDRLMENAHHHNTVQQYLIYHDCGKPFCRVVDEAGKTHFPDHAKVSRSTFLECWPDEQDDKKTIANLIGWDMVLHTANADEVDRCCREEWSIQDACTLILAALCEVHSNARMFGGIESVSFKSKWKQLDRRGRQICKFYFGVDR